MEEDMLLSMVSNTTPLNEVVGGEGCSDSSRSNSNSPRGSSNKRQRRFKGVVLQPNGHWGAQVYTNRDRIWIGTFNSESEAAKAYDSVAVKLRSEDSHRNYPLTNLTSLEPDFLKLFTLEQVKNMLKDGSYETKLYEFANACSSKQDKEPGLSLSLFAGSANDGAPATTYRKLFKKQLTPSDVGKLNRLVIPKSHAENYFPAVSKEERDGGVIDDIQLPFFDREMKCWKFRYCFWRSSQSYVFSRDWNRFVKYKKLEAKDVVTFYWCECREEHKAFYMIDVAPCGGESGGGGSGVHGAGNRVDLQLGFGRATINESEPSDRSMELWRNKEDNVVMEVAPPQPEEEKKTFRLFGVKII